MRSLLAALLLIGCAGGGDGAPQASDHRDAAARDALAARIEANMRLPEGAAPLAEYTRSYAYAPGGREVEAVYMREPPGGRSWVEHNDLPFILDGGCRQVTIRADATTGRVLSVRCNGEA
jgi:hypothetical protein